MTNSADKTKYSGRTVKLSKGRKVWLGIHPDDGSILVDMVTKQQHFQFRCTREAMDALVMLYTIASPSPSAKEDIAWNLAFQFIVNLASGEGKWVPALDDGAGNGTASTRQTADEASGMPPKGDNQ